MRTIEARTDRMDLLLDQWSNQEVVDFITVRAEDTPRLIVSVVEAKAAQRKRDENRPLPDQLIARYVLVATAGAKVEELQDGSGWYADIPGFDGVWAEGETEVDALSELRSVLRDWIALKMEHRHGDIPVRGGIDLNRG